MTHFTEEQLTELQIRFGLIRNTSTTNVRDGVTTRGDKVWFREWHGPVQIDTTDAETWKMVCDFPNDYEIKKPIYRAEYKD